LVALRQADTCHKNAYDQYLIEVVERELSGQPRQDVFQLEAAVYTVAQIAEVGDATVIASMAALLAHRHDRVRKAVVSSFPRIVARRDSAAVAAVAVLAGHADMNVRHAALFTLGEIAERGNGIAVSVVVEAFEDEEGYVRHVAVKAFAHIAKRGDAAAIAAVVALLEDPCLRVRYAALRTLTEIAKHKMEGDAEAVIAVAARLEDEQEDVRLEAVLALAKITKKDDPDVIAEISARFTHWHEEVRIAAVYAFTQMQQKGRAAIAAVADLLEDSDVSVRKAAVKAFPQISDKGDPVAIASLATRLEDTNGSVRHAAEDALLQIAGGHRSDGAAIAALISIAHIKFRLLASLQIPNEDNLAGEEEAVLAAAASLEDAKLHLVMRPQDLLISRAKARNGSRTKVTRYDYLNGKEGDRVRLRARKADGPRVVRKSQSAGGTRCSASFYADVYDLLTSPRYLFAQFCLLAVFWAFSKSMSRFCEGSSFCEGNIGHNVA
jgi:HEAT repeat protein